MPIQVVDDFGAWDDLGTVEPVFEQWLDFPDYTESTSGLLRLFFSALEFDKETYAYIRCVYEVSTTYMVGRWIRIYPKFEPESIIYPHPEDLAGLKSIPRRFYQIQKRHRLRRYIGTHKSKLWSVNLQVCNEQIDGGGSNEQTPEDLPAAFFLGIL